MALFKTIAVILDGNKEVYRKGETVTGSLELDVGRNVTVKGIRVNLCGATMASWKLFNDQFMDFEKFFDLVYTVSGMEENASGAYHTLTAGQHSYTFKFEIPNKNLPSSFEGENGITRYWVQVEIVMTFPKVNKQMFRGITILDDIDVKHSQYKAPVAYKVQKQVSKFLGFGDAGSVTLIAETDRGAYCAGEKVALKVVVKNESTKNLGKLKAQLEQKILYKVKHEDFECIPLRADNVIRILEGTAVTKGEDRVWKDHLLVDFIPPSTKATSSRIITVSYFIKVLVEVFLGNNIEVRLPITIGTIPYDHTPAAKATAEGTKAGTSTEVGVSTAYAKCTRGFNSCANHADFSNFKYVPMCSYVVNNTLNSPDGGAAL